MLATLLYVLLIGYLPGAVLFRMPGSSRVVRAALRIDERLFWAVILSIVWSLGVVLALAAAGQYSFSRLLIVNGITTSALAAIARGRLLYIEPLDRRGLWPLLFPACLIALGSWLYLPASEYIVGGKDPGSYVNEGVQIAQRGSLVVHDPVIA